MMAPSLFPLAPDTAEGRQALTSLANVPSHVMDRLEQVMAGDDPALFRRQQRAFRRWMLRRAGWRARLSTQVARHHSKR